MEIQVKTKQDFNEKYTAYLAEGHYGLALHNEDVINYLDKRFETLIKVPGFKFYQIKAKYGFITFYCDGLTQEEIYQEECKIQEVLDESYKQD